MAHVYTNSIMVPLYGLVLAERQGLSIAKLCTEAGVNPSVFQDPDARIPITDHQKLMELITHYTGNDQFFLRPLDPELGAVQNALWYYFFNAENLTEAAHRAERLYTYHTDIFYPESVLTKQEYLIRVSTRVAGFPIINHQVDMMLSIWWGNLQMFAGPAIKLQSVRITNASKTREKAYQDFFGVPVLVDQPYNELVFEPRMADLPNVRQDIDPNLDNLLSRFFHPTPAPPTQPQTFQGEIFSAIQQQFLQETPSVKNVAVKLGLSSRTLQRRLAEMNTSFSELLRNTRKELVATYLQQPNLRITEIAFMLGFSDTSSLTNFCRQCYGVTPSQYRQGLDNNNQTN